MITTATKRPVFLLASILFCAPAIALGDAVKPVDCARGETIREALQKKDPSLALTLVIRGTCAEHVTISQDDVTLQGDGGAISGVTIDGARRAEIAGLSISNPVGNGVTVINGASAALRGNQINDSSGYGVLLRNAAFAVVNDNTMLRNGIVNNTDVDASGIGVALGSTVRAARNEIRENANTGIEVFDNSAYRSEGDTIAQRTTLPGRSAVDTFRAAYVDLRGATVSGLVIVGQQAHLQMRNLEGLPASITGNIAVSQLSFLRLRAGVTRVASNLGCGGGFSLCQCDGFPGSVCPVSVP